MRFNKNLITILVSLSISRHAGAFSTPSSLCKVCHKDTSLKVSIGLGPEAEGKGDQVKINEENGEEEAIIAEPDHELFRESRLSQFDRDCDDWYGRILKQGEPSLLGKVSEEALRRILTLPKLEREPKLPVGHEDWTPYKETLLPGSPILPSYGLEQYGLPIVRRNAEAWRQFDVTGLVGTDYSGSVAETGIDLTLDNSVVEKYTTILKANGAWIDDDKCSGRLIYINGRFVPSLSMISNVASNLKGDDITEDAVIECMNRLPDGFCYC